MIFPNYNYCTLYYLHIAFSQNDDYSVVETYTIHIRDNYNILLQIGLKFNPALVGSDPSPVIVCKWLKSEGYYIIVWLCCLLMRLIRGPYRCVCWSVGLTFLVISSLCVSNGSIFRWMVGVGMSLRRSSNWSEWLLYCGIVTMFKIYRA